MGIVRSKLVALAIVTLLGCGDEAFRALPDATGLDRDAMPRDASPADGPPSDGATTDGTPGSDSGMDSAAADSSTSDTVVVPDSSTTPDSVVPDAGTPDTTTPDSVVPDAGMPDTVIPDTSLPDASFDATPDANDAGTQIPACDAATWCQETAPVPGKLLAGVWAVKPDDVFVVGAGGLILHRSGTAWTQMSSNTTADLAGVWAASSNDVWAVGTGGTIRRYDGATWRTITLASTLDFNAVWGSGPDDVWISGFGAVLHWNGSAFETKALPGTLYALTGTSATDVWATGETAFVDHFTGTWTTAIKPDGNISTWFAIHAITPTNVFVAGFTPGRETMQWNGTTWTPRTCKLGNSGCIFQAFFSTSATNLWGVGGGKIGHWNGTAWTAEAPLGGTAQLWDVSGSGSHVYVVGSDSVILHRN